MRAMTAPTDGTARRLAILGGGQMGGAILARALASGLYAPADVTVSDALQKRQHALKESLMRRLQRSLKVVGAGRPLDRCGHRDRHDSPSPRPRRDCACHAEHPGTGRPGSDGVVRDHRRLTRFA
ncbi:MAG: hypothetical protein EBS89_05390 [Proteobacteria bacterium]|nr:hypothetical protein [Pseudomonadota bacterium]